MWREIVGLGDQASLATSKAMHGVPFYGPTLDSRPVPARLFLLCGPLRKHVLLHDLSGERRIARGRDKYLASYYLGKLCLTRRTINFSLETLSGNREESQRRTIGRTSRKELSMTDCKTYSEGG